MFLSRNKKNHEYPCKPQVYYIKVGLRGSKLYKRVFVMKMKKKKKKINNKQRSKLGSYNNSCVYASHPINEKYLIVPKRFVIWLLNVSLPLKSKGSNS